MLQIQMIVEKIFLKNAETIDFCKLITPLATTHVWPIKRRMGQTPLFNASSAPFVLCDCFIFHNLHRLGQLLNLR